MSRIRSIHPKFFNDKDLSALPFWVRLLFIALWTLADREGRLLDRPDEIKPFALPYDKVDIEKGLQLLAQPKTIGNGAFIRRYEVDGRRYIQVLKWHDYQHPHHTEKDSEMPAPPPINKNKIKISVHEATAPLNTREVSVKKEDFLTAIKSNSAYKHIDIDRELAKMDAWLSVHHGRQKTRGFVVNWLNKIEPPLTTTPSPKPWTPPPKPKPKPEEMMNPNEISKLIKGVVGKIGGGK